MVFSGVGARGDPTRALLYHRTSINTYCTRRKRKDIVLGSWRELATAETPLCKSRTGKKSAEERCWEKEEMNDEYGSQEPLSRGRPSRASKWRSVWCGANGRELGLLAESACCESSLWGRSASVLLAVVASKLLVL